MLVGKRERPMNLHGIREALRRQQFEPFNICLTNGASLAIPNPKTVVIGKRRIIVAELDAPWSVIKPLLIVSFD
jgi:hypothetical protein